MSEVLIYSNEHRAFWKPDSQGYTMLLHEAGRYDRSEAARIVAQANSHRSLDMPNEVMVLAPDREHAVNAFFFAVCHWPNAVIDD
jgi:hypothetical protein